MWLVRQLNRGRIRKNDPHLSTVLTSLDTKICTGNLQICAQMYQLYNKLYLAVFLFVCLFWVVKMDGSDFCLLAIFPVQFRHKHHKLQDLKLCEVIKLFNHKNRTQRQPPTHTHTHLPASLPLPLPRGISWQLHPERVQSFPASSNPLALCPDRTHATPTDFPEAKMLHSACCLLCPTPAHAWGSHVAELQWGAGGNLEGQLMWLLMNSHLRYFHLCQLLKPYGKAIIKRTGATLTS